MTPRLFTSFEATTVTLTRVNQDASHLLKLLSGDLTYPGCSRDGKFVYYVNRHRPQKVWRISTDGGPPVEIGPGMGEGIAGSLDGSPDGRLLSYPFIQYRPNAWKLAVLPASGGPAIKIFDVPGGASRVGGPRRAHLCTTSSIGMEQPTSGNNRSREENQGS